MADSPDTNAPHPSTLSVVIDMDNAENLLRDAFDNMSTYP